MTASGDDGRRVRLGAFARGPARFTVERTDDEPARAYRVVFDDGAAPREICRLSGDRHDPVQWHSVRAWADWAKWIEAEAHAAIEHARHHRES